MTADRREYSRKGFDMMGVPPPAPGVPPPDFPPGMVPPHIAGSAPGLVLSFVLLNLLLGMCELKFKVVDTLSIPYRPDYKKTSYYIK